MTLYDKQLKMYNLQQLYFEIKNFNHGKITEQETEKIMVNTLMNSYRCSIAKYGFTIPDITEVKKQITESVHKWRINSENLRITP